MRIFILLLCFLWLDLPYSTVVAGVGNHSSTPRHPQLPAISTNQSAAGTTPAFFQYVNCDLCRHPFLIILATGRSGSTTLMDMVNELVGYDIGGEHNGLLEALYESYLLFASSLKRLDSKEGDTLDKHNYLCWMQEWFFLSAGHREHFVATEVHGFKEIRYAHNIPLMKFLAMELFPCAKFIVNYRLDVDAQSQSGFFKNAKNSNAQLEQDTIHLQQFAQHFPSRVFEMPLEMFSNLTRWNQLFTFLDRPSCRADSVLHANANSSYKGDTRSVVDCRLRPPPQHGRIHQ